MLFFPAEVMSSENENGLPPAGGQTEGAGKRPFCHPVRDGLDRLRRLRRMDPGRASLLASRGTRLARRLALPVPSSGANYGTHRIAMSVWSSAGGALWLN